VTKVVTLLDSTNTVVGTFSTIQAAVTAAAGSNHDTISISAGTFQEQVLIDGSQVQNLTIVGAGAGVTTILSPDAGSLAENFTTAQNTHEYHNQDPLIGIENGANVTIENLTIDGNNQVSSMPRATMAEAIWSASKR
jgi:pectin methylesterase-like acyl-CoA thioesterase